MAESMTIGELADLVGMTVRNIRAYQSKGLLFPPEIRGRVAHYSGAHAARLELLASVQREAFTLAAIKRLIDVPDSYAHIVADRRRRFREGVSDIPTAVPVPEHRIRELLPDLPEDLTETGLAWRKDGELHSHIVLVGVGRTLVARGVPLDLVAELQLESARVASRLGQTLREKLASSSADAEGRVSDLARVAVQLAATAFEIAFLKSATEGSPADG